MGGKNAVIIDSDADLDEAIVDTIYSAFGYQGQKCSACSRLIVLEENYSRVIERLLPRPRVCAIGNPEEPGITVGPVIDRDRLQAYPGIHRERQKRSDVSPIKKATFRRKVSSFRRQFSPTSAGNDHRVRRNLRTGAQRDESARSR